MRGLQPAAAGFQRGADFAAKPFCEKLSPDYVVSLQGALHHGLSCGITWPRRLVRAAAEEDDALGRDKADAHQDKSEREETRRAAVEAVEVRHVEEGMPFPHG